jgi:murein DD-endopeptidase
MMLVRLQLCIVLSLLLACASGASASDGGRPRLVQSLDVQIPAPPTPFVAAGKRRLAYELHLTNFTTHDVALTRVQIVDAERAQPLAEYRDSALAERLGRPGLKSEDADVRLLAGGMRAVLFLWIDLDDRAPTPGRLRHQIDLEIMRPAGRESVSLQAGDVGVGKQAPVALSAPLRGGPWVALYDPSMKFGHRTSLYTVDGRARIPARFAIDWVRLEHDATHARGDDAAAANWHGYGADVLAVADGVVAQAQDDLPALDAVSASKGPMSLENASGDYVVLDIGDGRHVFYEHLQHGSVQVKAGDRVRRGQVIARLGNTGSSSSGPHLHFHVADAPSTLAAEGVPYVFRTFEVIGAFDAIGDFATNTKWRAAPAGEAGARRMELPDANVVIMFPAH